MQIKLVVAMDRNGGIGFKNKLPWGEPISAYIHNFKKLTLGKTVLMGRKTWESLPEKFRPLPGRRNIVLTRDRDYVANNAYTVYNFDPSIAPSILQNSKEEIFVIGGRQLFEIFEPLATKMYITLIDAEFEVDTYFPSYDRVGWKQKLPNPKDFVPKGDTSHFNLQFIEMTRTHPLA